MHSFPQRRISPADPPLIPRSILGYSIRCSTDTQELADLLKLTAEKILLRWMNYHLKKAGSTRVVNNFSGDIKDSEARAGGLWVVGCGL